MRFSRPFAPSFYFSLPCPASRCGTIKIGSKGERCAAWQVRCSGGTEMIRSSATARTPKISPPFALRKGEALSNAKARYRCRLSVAGVKRPGRYKSL
jgi:hypothetical protein